MPVTTTMKPLNATKQEVSIMTWNVLNQKAANRHNKVHHGNVNPYLNTFETRCKHIAKEILRVNADVVMLQEVDREHFPALGDALKDTYEGRIKDSSHSWTNATFYRKSKFKFAFHDSRGARTFAMGLRRSKSNDPILVFVNVCKSSIFSSPNRTRSNHAHRYIWKEIPKKLL